jgi:hypothetical protein
MIEVGDKGHMEHHVTHLFLIGVSNLKYFSDDISILVQLVEDSVATG